MSDWIQNKGKAMPIFTGQEYISIRFRGVPGYIAIPLKLALEQGHWTWTWKGKAPHMCVDQYRQQDTI